MTVADQNHPGWLLLRERVRGRGGGTHDFEDEVMASSASVVPMAMAERNK